MTHSPKADEELLQYYYSNSNLYNTCLYYIE